MNNCKILIHVVVYYNKSLTILTQTKMKSKLKTVTIKNVDAVLLHTQKLELLKVIENISRSKGKKMTIDVAKLDGLINLLDSIEEVIIGNDIKLLLKNYESL